MSRTSPTRLNGVRGSRRLGTASIEPHTYVAFKVDPHASLAILGDPKTDFYTTDLLEPEHSKVYVGLVLDAQRLVRCGRFQLTLSVIGPRPATLSQDDTNTLVPIISSAALYDPSITRYPVYPTPPLSLGPAYHYPKVIRVMVSAIVYPKRGLFPCGFPTLDRDDVARLRKYAAHDAQQMARTIHRPDSEASQVNQDVQDLQPMNMAAEIAHVKAAIQRAPWGAFDSEMPLERRDRLRLLHHETDPTLPGGILHWEPVVTVWMNLHEAGDSLTPPEMLDTEIALLKRIADIFNRRWIEWVRAIYVHRSTRQLYLPLIYDRQGPTPSKTAVIVEDSVPPSGLATQNVATRDVATPNVATPDVATPDVATRDVATRDVVTRDVVTRDVAMRDVATPDVTTVHHLESSQGDARCVAAAVIIPIRLVPVPTKSQRNNRPDRRASRLRNARAAINKLTTAAKVVGKGVRLATIGSYYVAKFSFKAVRYVVTKSLTFSGRALGEEDLPSYAPGRSYQGFGNPNPTHSYANGYQIQSRTQD